MKVKIKRFDKALPLPKYATARSAALDLCARIQVEIEPRSTVLIPLNIAIQPPPDCWVLLSARSSLHKKGLMLANGIGIGDEDYCGNNDEYMAAIWNFSDRTVVVEKGERVAQMMVLQREKVELVEADELKTNNRGGFGSTGK